MRILVTGGAGYVGASCLRFIAKKGHDVLAYDNLREGHPSAVDKNPLVVGDIADAAKLAATLEEFRADAVMHFAAATCVGESVEDPEYHYRNNIGGTLRLLNDELYSARVPIDEQNDIGLNETPRHIGAGS
jgi:UDP-glucose 4-epimerase